MKHKILWAVFVVIFAAAGSLVYLHGNRERLFLNRAFVQLSGGGGSEPVADIKLDSGESAAVILEHDCCSGGGFDAVAIRFSEGDEFYARKNYCGIEGFYGALKTDATKDLNRFKAFLSAQGYRKK